MADDAVPGDDGPRLLAVSDLHIGYPVNRAIADRIEPASAADWLILAGDVAEKAEDIEWVLRTFSQRFAKVIWVPGNHELWTHGRDRLRLRGEDRYQHLVAVCRTLGVLTPEDPYPVWAGPGGPVLVVPLFLLYDYSFQAEVGDTKDQGLERAYAAGVVCQDELLLHPDPYASREAWCEARLALTERRLDDLPAGMPTVLVNHYPLVREPTAVLRYPSFVQWCGTARTADWPARYHAQVVVYGHLHIPRTTWYGGVRHEEVSLGYPSEWGRRARTPVVPRQILPAPAPAPGT